MAKISPWIFHALLLLCFLGGNHLYPLWDNNEGLYATIAQEMLHTHQWIIPHVNGLPYIEKPPLLYWLTALSFNFFGENAWSARFIPALSAYSIAVLIKYILDKQNPGKGWQGAWIWLTCFGALLWGRMVFFDMLFTFLLTASLIAFWQSSHTNNRVYQRISYGLLAFAMLTKGLVAGIFYGLIVIIYGLWMRWPWPKWKHHILDAGSWAVWIILWLPWHIFALYQQPDFAWFYFINEHILRFLDLREPRDYYHGPFYYYIPRFLLILFPWTGLLVKFRLRPLSSFERFLIVWFATIFTFFSLSQAKANYYIILAVPPFILWSIPHLHSILKTSYGKIMTGVSTFIFLISQIIFCSMSLHLFPALSISLNPIWAICICAGLIIGAVALVLFYRRKQYESCITTLGTMSLIWFFHLMIQLPSQQSYYSTAELIPFIPENGRSSLYIFEDYEDFSALKFYNQHPITIINSQSRDLWYSQQRNPDHLHFIRVDAFNDIQKPSWVVVKPHKAGSFKALCNHQATLVYQTPRVHLYRIDVNS